MQCRARSGAQALNYIWTTDDILADAFSRFVRVSNACRRFGSNVPGPLEARRRSAKRRMGMVSSISDVGNTNIAPGLRPFASFRVPKETPLSESTWQWTPPGSPRTRPQEVEQSHVNEFRTIKVDSAETETPADRIDRSVQTFQGLLKAVDTEEVTADDLRFALDYLEGAEDVGEAQNTLRLLRWMAVQKVHTTVHEALEKIILRKIRSQNMAKDELSALILYLTNTRHGALYPNRIPLIHAILDELDPSDLKRVVWTNTRRLAELPRVRELAPRPLTHWLMALNSCASLQGQHVDSIIWNAIYRHLSARFSPKELQLHFGPLDQPNLARILLKHWVPRISQDPEWLDIGGAIVLRMNNNPRVHRKDLQAEYDSLPAGPDSLALARLVDLLAQHQIPQHHLSSEIFEIISRRCDPDVVIKYVQFFATSRGKFMPMIPGWGSTLVNYLVGVDTEVSLKLAMDVAERYTSILLSTIPDLFPALVRKGYHDGDWTRRIFVLLCRKAPGDTVKMSDRIRTRLQLTKPVVKSVHLMAKAFAEVRDLNPRTAFRRVWQCYRFLHDRGAPTRRSLSQAFVQAGLVNFLEAGRYIPTMQARYILSIVEVHDGHETADEMDQMLWTVMRQNRSRQYEPVAEAKNTPPKDFRPRIWKAGKPRWLEDRRKLNQQQVDSENGLSLDDLEKALGLCDDSEGFSDAPAVVVEHATSSVAGPEHHTLDDTDVHSTEDRVRHKTTPSQVFCGTDTSNPKDSAPLDHTSPFSFASEYRDPTSASRMRAPGRTAANPKAPAETSQSHQTKEAGAGEAVSATRPSKALADYQLPHAQVVDTLAPATKATASTAKPSNPFLPSPLPMRHEEDPSGQTASVKEARLPACSTTDSLGDADSLKTLLKQYANTPLPTASKTFWHEPRNHSATVTDANQPTTAQPEKKRRKYTRGQRRDRTATWVGFDEAWAKRKEKVTGEKREAFVRDLNYVKPSI